MGTNFYVQAGVTCPTCQHYTSTLTRKREFDWETDDDLRVDQVHIGKRSAAGLYCYDCCQSLCKGGESRVHCGGGLGEDRAQTWHEACPQCGGKPGVPGNLARGPVAVELGFAQPEVTRPTGVSGCASFSWAMKPKDLDELSATPGTQVVDEYGRKQTIAEFLTMLKNNCPIQFYDSIGTSFS